MSDMNTPEVPVEGAVSEPVAEVPAAPEATPAVDPPAEPVETPTSPEATPVVARIPSSQSPTQQPESAPEVDAEPIPLADAVRVLLILVKAHRKAGDSDLESAIADVEAALEA